MSWKLSPMETLHFVSLINKTFEQPKNNAKAWQGWYSISYILYGIYHCFKWRNTWLEKSFILPSTTHKIAHNISWHIKQFPSLEVNQSNVHLFLRCTSFSNHLTSIFTSMKCRINFFNCQIQVNILSTLFRMQPDVTY